MGDRWRSQSIALECLGFCEESLVALRGCMYHENTAQDTEQETS